VRVYFQSNSKHDLGMYNVCGSEFIKWWVDFDEVEIISTEKEKKKRKQQQRVYMDQHKSLTYLSTAPNMINIA